MFVLQHFFFFFMCLVWFETVVLESQSMELGKCLAQQLSTAGF